MPGTANILCSLLSKRITMINKVISTIKKYDMISDGSVVVAAVSGGSDSMAMLHILDCIKGDLGFKLKAVHVNHGIRGKEADADESFVIDYCKKNGIPLKVCKADVIGEAKTLGMGLEEAGRKIRYNFFESYGKDVLIATAHNLSDRAETFLFNFARGSVLRGLGSIPPVRDNYIRPLINCTKAEIEDFCKENSIDYVTDKSNSDVRYSRNRIRHKIVPELYEINSSFEQSAARCIDSLCEDEAYLGECADKLVAESVSGKCFDAKILSLAPAPIKKRAVIRIIESFFGFTPEYKAVEEICFILSNGGSRQINGGVTVRVRGGMLEFPSECDCSIEPFALECGDFQAGNATVTVNICEINSLQNISNNNSIYFIDSDKIIGEAYFRSRQAGDRIFIKKRGCTKSLKKIFNEMKIPPEKRDSLVILSDESGVILVEGVGVDYRTEISKETRNILKIEIKR